ncbi:MAG: YkgJ family cysteine cluster protein [Nannocystis sp.]|nr:YkgJ family cysteine cluster protein [Nannocystis sp.]
MLLGLLRALFGPKIRLPSDHVTRISGAAKKAGAADAAAAAAAIDKIGALPDIADIATTKRLPKGLDALVREMLAAYERYVEAVAKAMNLSEAARPGTPEGAVCCKIAPIGVTALESMVIFRTVRLWRDFPQVAQRLASLAEMQIKDIQKHHVGDPEKVAMTSKAVQQGRLDYARRGETCPFLDTTRGRCRIWEIRPMVCRMQHVRGDVSRYDPSHAEHAKVDVKNIRLPIRQQAALMQLEKRLVLQMTPFLFPNLLLLLQLAEGQSLPEVGEAPPRFGNDGLVVAKANRQNPEAKKFQKEKEKQKRR